MPNDCWEPSWTWTSRSLTSITVHGPICPFLPLVIVTNKIHKLQAMTRTLTFEPVFSLCHMNRKNRYNSIPELLYPPLSHLVIRSLALFGMSQLVYLFTTLAPPIHDGTTWRNCLRFRFLCSVRTHCGPKSCGKSAGHTRTPRNLPVNFG